MFFLFKKKSLISKQSLENLSLSSNTVAKDGPSRTRESNQNVLLENIEAWPDCLEISDLFKVPTQYILGDKPCQI